jgi:Helix-turn-helix domain
VQIRRGYRTELNLNNKQMTACKKHAGAARYAHNWGLKRKQEVYQTTGRSISAMELHRELNQLKQTELPWMYEVSRHLCRIGQVEEMLTNLGEPLDSLEAED